MTRIRRYDGTDLHNTTNPEVIAAANYTARRELHAGWTVAGKGSQRTLLRSPNGRHYKVPNEAGRNDSTYAEITNWAKLSEAGWSVPEHTLYVAYDVPGEDMFDEWTVPVVEVEYVQADGTDGDVEAAMLAMADLRIADINPSNIVVRDGEPVIVDAGGVL